MASDAPSGRGTHPGGGRRLAVLALAVAAAIFTVTVVVIRLGDDAAAPSSGIEEPETAEDPAIALARRFAPLYYFRMQDGACDRHGEAFTPSPVELVLGAGEQIRLRQLGSTTVPAPTAADLAAAGSTAFLDFPGDPRNPRCRYERDFNRLARDVPATVYARIAREPGRAGFALQYWSFYYFNDWSNTHEGDWEMVQLIFEVDTVEQALQVDPTHAVYAQHAGGERQNWDDSHLQKAGRHPVVYVSVGSHASYFEPNTHLGLGERGTGLGCDVTIGPHRALLPAVTLLRETPEALAGDEAWLTFPGRWGQATDERFAGPTGPQTKRVWHRPMSWADDARGGSATVPAADVLGVNAVRRFCTVVEVGSDALRTYTRFPVLVGTSVALVLGTVSVAGLVVLRDLARGSHVPRETVAFLEYRRSLGQMIRAAAIVYGRRPLLFLGISVAFVPVDIAISLLQPWLITRPPLDYVLWLLNANEVSQLLLGLLFGGLASFAVYIFVMSGATAAVRALDERRPIGVETAYATALRCAPNVLLGRARTFLPIGLLGLSIVGIPVAIWLAVRWFFVEEAVILDGKSHWRAPGASSSAVAGQWVRALLLALFFGVLGAFAGPLLAFGLLLGTETNPALVNIIAGLFHTAFLPFTAIGLAMAYRDLQIRSREARFIEAAFPAKKHGGLRRATDVVTGSAIWVLHHLEGRRGGH